MHIEVKAKGFEKFRYLGEPNEAELCILHSQKDGVSVITTCSNHRVECPSENLRYITLHDMVVELQNYCSKSFIDYCIDIDLITVTQ